MLRKCAIFSPIYLSGRSIAATTASRASITSTLPECPRPVFHFGSDSYAGSLDVFEQMPHRGLLRAPSDFSTFLSTCAKSGSLSAGVQAHSLILKLGLDSNVFIGSALISLYCKCSSFSEARRVFDAVPKRNVVTWNSLLYGYSIPIWLIGPLESSLRCLHWKYLQRQPRSLLYWLHVQSQKCSRWEFKFNVWG